MPIHLTEVGSKHCCLLLFPYRTHFALHGLPPKTKYFGFLMLLGMAFIFMKSSRKYWQHGVISKQALSSPVFLLKLNFLGRGRVSYPHFTKLHVQEKMAELGRECPVKQCTSKTGNLFAARIKHVWIFKCSLLIALTPPKFVFDCPCAASAVFLSAFSSSRSLGQGRGGGLVLINLWKYSRLKKRKKERKTKKDKISLPRWVSNLRIELGPPAAQAGILLLGHKRWHNLMWLI